MPQRCGGGCGAELLQQPLGDFVGPLIFGNFLANDEDVWIAAHLFRHGVAQCFAHRHRHHLGTGRHLGFGNFNLRGEHRGLGLGGRKWGGFGGFLGGCRRCSRRRLDCHGFERRLVLALREDHGDWGIYGDVGGAFRHQNLTERSLVGGFHLHGGFVGLDLGEDIAGFDLVALAFVPLGKVALFHGRRQRGHQNLDRHSMSRNR